mgnify:CR=1 FL=1
MPPAGCTLRLTLDVDQRSSDGRYRVLVRTVEGEIVWSGDAAASVTTGSQPLPLTVEFPAALLTPGEYTAVLGSISSNGDFESQATYPFSISAP